MGTVAMATTSDTAIGCSMDVVVEGLLGAGPMPIPMLSDSR